MNRMQTTWMYLLLLVHFNYCLGDPYSASVHRFDMSYRKDHSAEIVSAKAKAGVEIHVTVDTGKSIGRVKDYFISFNMDSEQFSQGSEIMNFSSVRLHTLMRALSPALLRVGGSPADWLFFDKPLSVLRAAGLRPDCSVATKQDIIDLVKLTRSTGNRLLYDLNLQLRFGQQWDPSNAIELFEFCQKHGFGENIYWELGNEPEYNSITHPEYSSNVGIGQIVLSPEQIADDFVRLHRILRLYPNFNRSKIVGPDVVGVSPESKALKIIQAVANSSGDFLSAITFHHYYFRGDIATYKEYIDPKHFDNLSYIIGLVRSAVDRSKYPKLPLWIGETSDSWHAGTAGVSDRFVSGFLWLDKLGVSAQKGIGVVMRQTLYGLNYSLVDRQMNPNPDFWLCALHRHLVGRTVLKVSLSGAPETTRVYAQCTSTKSGVYRPGAVTVFGLNVSPDSVTEFSFQGTVLENLPIDAYVLSPSDGLLSKFVLLNGKQRLVMPSETEMPVFTPDRLPTGSKVKLMPLTFGFFVFPDVNVEICKT